MKVFRVPPSRPSLSLVEPEMWKRLDADEKIAVRVLVEHIRFRFGQRDHEPLEPIDGELCGIFLTNRHVQALLVRLRYRKTGLDFARQVISTLLGLGLIVDSGETRKPRRSTSRVAAAAKFSHGPADTSREGGREAQPSRDHSFWWRVFKIVPLYNVLLASRPCGAYRTSASFLERPRVSASLCRFLIRQGLLSPRSRRRRFRRGSVQWVFANSGPP